MRLSLAMIVRNEAESIREILTDAAVFCDELVVVDTGSVDGTPGIASSLGASVYHFEWCDDFAAARNYSFSQATGDWIFWADADDRIPRHCAERWREDIEKASEAGASSVWGEYRYGEGLIVLRERALRADAGFRWEGLVHEVVSTDWSNRHISTAYVEHHRTVMQALRDYGRNLRILERAYDHGDRTPRTLLYLAREYKDHSCFALAAERFEQYLQVSTAPWERFEALIQKGECHMAVDRNGPDTLDCAHEAMRLIPTRAEGYLLAGRVHYNAGQWCAAIPLFLAATGATRPSDGIFSEADYSHLPWDYLAQCYARVGDTETAARITVEKLLNKTPDDDRIRKNLTYFTNPDWRPTA